MKPVFAFFGTSELSIYVLDALKEQGFLPSIIVATRDMPQGRNLIITAPLTKIWAEKNGIPCIQPPKLDSAFTYKLQATSYQLFLVASYGKIIPKSILELPKHGTLNVHPSLLPKFRGPSPIQSQILADDKECGVTIMQIDEEMDHGPILNQEIVEITDWPPKASVLEETLGKEGGRLLAKTIPIWVSGKISPQEQDHSQATYTKKFEKGDGLIDFSLDSYQNFLKIRAFEGGPGTYFFAEHRGTKIRVKIADAEHENGKLVLTRVIPEGKREMSYADFERNN